MPLPPQITDLMAAEKVHYLAARLLYNAQKLVVCSWVGTTTGRPSDHSLSKKYSTGSGFALIAVCSV